MKILPVAIFLLSAAFGADDYVLGPDSQPHAGVPKGKVTKYSWTASKIFPGTTRDYWVYVPAQYDGSKPACVMIFQDGSGFQNETGAWRAPVVFDNLIQQGAMPVTIAIFIDPGVLPAGSPNQQARFNRSYEYDGMGPRYARFLIEEILPEVGKQFKLSSDPNDRALAGSSSGGIASFTAAWERPDAFRRVLSFIGSYTNLRGGDAYTSLVRKMEPKPLRVFLQDGSNDQNIYSGSWYLANQELAKSLEYAGYDTKFEVGHRRPQFEARRVHPAGCLALAVARVSRNRSPREKAAPVCVTTSPRSSTLPTIGSSSAKASSPPRDPPSIRTGTCISAPPDRAS